MHPNKFTVLGSAAGLLLAFCEVGGKAACQHLVGAKAYSHKHGMVRCSTSPTNTHTTTTTTYTTTTTTTTP